MVHMDTGAAVPAHTCTAGNGGNFSTLPRFHLQTQFCVVKLLLLFVLLVTSLGKRGRRRADLKAQTMVS